MRRLDREMDKNFALSIIDKCEWAVISMIDPQGSPYCLPISIVRVEDKIYFHCAKQGKKIECLRYKNQVCLNAVGDTYRLEKEFTTEYESAIVFGTAVEIVEDDEKIRALHALCIRHTPKNMANFESEVKESLQRTAVWKIEIKEISGKRKKYDKDGNEMKFGRME